MLTDIIIKVAIVLIIGAAAVYIIWAKKKGRKCIGCPDSASCAKQKNKSSCVGDKVGTYACSGKCNSCTVCSGDKSEPHSDGEKD